MASLKALLDTPVHAMEIHDAEGSHSATVFSALFGFIQLDKVPEVDAEGGKEAVNSVDALRCL